MFTDKEIQLLMKAIDCVPNDSQILDELLVIRGKLTQQLNRMAAVSKPPVLSTPTLTIKE